MVKSVDLGSEVPLVAALARVTALREACTIQRPGSEVVVTLDDARQQVVEVCPCDGVAPCDRGKEIVQKLAEAGAL